MEEIRIFIASSKDVVRERIALESLFSTLNRSSNKQGINITTIMWELESKKFTGDLNPKQTEYNNSLASSNIVFFLFGKRVGKHTLEEFDYACKERRDGNPLKIVAYFKDENFRTGNSDKSAINDLKKVAMLKERIENDLKQVHGDYKNIQELQPQAAGELLEILLTLKARVNNSLDTDGKLDRLTQLYNQISQPFQRTDKEIIINSAIEKLHFLLTYNKSPKLTEESFYDLCQEIIGNTSNESYIKALSLMLKCEWDNSEDEINFWRANVDAVHRNVSLERIFIVNRNEAHRLKTNPQISNHIATEKDCSFLKSYAIEKEDLAIKNNQLLREAGKGFLLIDDPLTKIALLDEDYENGQRATPVLDEKEIKKLLDVFADIKKLAIPLKKYLENIHWSHYKKEMISIFVTTKCNLNCDYCFTNKTQDEHENQSISLDFVKKGIDDYFDTNLMRHVRFFGAGEPTVEIDLLKKIHSYAKQKGGEAVSFEIQTNGAFNDSVADWLSENVDIIWVSCDGTPDIQDRHRPCLNSSIKSSELIEKNIRRLHNGKAFVGIRATITDENVNQQIKMIDYFSRLGIKDIWVDPIFPPVSKSSITNKNDFNTMNFAEKFLEATQYAYEKNLFYGSILTCNFNDSVIKHCRACIPVPHLTTDGFVSACDMALFGKDKNHMSELIYGKWDKDSNKIIYYDDAVKRLQNRTTDNMRHCEICSAKEHCGGYCLGEVLNETGDLLGCKKGVCEAIKFLDNKMPPEIRRYKYTHP